MGFFKQLAGKLQAVNDGTPAAPGIDRVQIGELLQYIDPLGTISPALSGIRLLDAVGRLMLDSEGIAGGIRLIGKSTQSGGSRVGSGSGQVMGDGRLDFGASNSSGSNFGSQQNVAIICFGLVNLSNSLGGASMLTDLSLDNNVDAGAGGSSISLGAASSGATTMVPVLLVGWAVVAPGGHTIAFRVSSPNTNTYTWTANGGIVAFAVGRSLF